MAHVSAFSVVREILTTNVEMPIDDVMAKARRKGVTDNDRDLRKAIHHTRSAMKAKAKATAKPMPVLAAARHVTSPKSEVELQPTLPTAASTDLSAAFANVTHVNAVVSACGGIENARQVAEAVRACGGVNEFLQHLDLVAGIRTADKAE